MNEWLSENGLTATKLTPTGDWLSFSITAKQAGDMLDTTFETFHGVQLSTGASSSRLFILSEGRLGLPPSLRLRYETLTQ